VRKMLIAQMIAFLIIIVVSIVIFKFFDIHIHADNKENATRPLGEGGLLVVAFAVNDISSSLSQSIEKNNPELPPIQLRDIGISYKDSDSWITVNDNLIIVFLYSDVANILTKAEIEAYALHEIGHVKLKHYGRRYYSRVIQEEISADIFAIMSGVKVDVLISAINKLSSNNDERSARIEVLGYLSK